MARRGRRRGGGGRSASPGSAPRVRGPIGAAVPGIPAPRTRITFTAGRRGAWNRTANRPLRPNATYVERNTGYTYRTDGHGRVSSFSGTLRSGSGHRNAYQQRVAGGRFRRPGDAGGHLFAHVFRGPGERINLVPMNANLNGSAWKRMENAWARALGRGSTVRVDGDIIYGRGSPSARPTRFEVTHQIDNHMPITHRFRNR